MYSVHKRKAVDVILKKRIYLEGTYQTFISEFLKKNNLINKVDIYEILLGYNWNQNDFDEPLSKMTFDIFNSLI